MAVKLKMGGTPKKYQRRESRFQGLREGRGGNPGNTERFVS